VQCKTGSLRGGVHCWFRRIDGRERPVEREKPEKSRIIIIIISQLYLEHNT
jgi:hypothetical protein